MNPCGKAVDVGRRPYTTKAKLVAGSDQLFTLVWYKADPKAGTLPFPSAITSLDWATNKTRETPIGEVFGQSRKYNGKWRVLGADGSHICGTEDDFLNGCKPADPPREYLPNGLPKCCRPDLRLGLGGLLLGGLAEVSVAPLAPCSTYVIDGTTTLTALGVDMWGALHWLLVKTGSAWALTHVGIADYTNASWSGHGCSTFARTGGGTAVVVCCGDA